MDWKSEQEWVVMRYFNQHLQGFPKGRLVKGESPDFQLWISAKRFIGIELTQVHLFNSESSAQCILDPELAVRQVNESVSLKEEKIQRYRASHPYQLWLIIFADYSEGGAMEKIAMEYRDNRIESSFDKVFLFDLDSCMIQPLK